MAFQIVDFVDPLVGWLPGLWGVATEHSMLQSQLLTTARKLSRCLGPMSVKLYGFTDPVLKYVLTQVYLYFHDCLAGFGYFWLFISLI